VSGVIVSVSYADCFEVAAVCLRAIVPASRPTDNHPEMLSVPASQPNRDSWDDYARLAANYYVAARFTALAGHVPPCGNLMHHAIELLLKCALIKSGAVPGGTIAPLSTRARFRGLRFLSTLGLIDAPSIVNEVDLFLRRRFGHRLKRLWKDFKRSHPATRLSHNDAVISSLDRWGRNSVSETWCADARRVRGIRPTASTAERSGNEGHPIL